MEHQDEGFVLVSTMNDANGGAPDVDAVAGWADGLGLTHPVLADTKRELSDYVVYGFPTYVVIDREMTIVHPDMWPWSDAAITELF